MRIIRELAALPPAYDGAFIPTLGALHEGHLALIRRAARSPHRPIVVSIFVNPTQFGPDEDLDRYPRQLEADVKAAQQAGAEFVFAPGIEAMYPPAPPDTPEAQIPIPPLPGVATPGVAIPGVATKPGLEDACRPGHFEGVCQVVARLFDLVRPRCAVFGEKDYQQLLVIRAMVEQERERWKGLEIISHETIREPDGLALSSRNVNLDTEQRGRARGLFQALAKAHQAIDPARAEAIMRQTLEAHDLEIDYAVVRDAQTLMPVETLEKPTRALIAARLGDLRLIDNMAIPARLH